MRVSSSFAKSAHAARTTTAVAALVFAFPRLFALALALAPALAPAAETLGAPFSTPWSTAAPCDKASAGPFSAAPPTAFPLTATGLASAGSTRACWAAKAERDWKTPRRSSSSLASASHAPATAAAAGRLPALALALAPASRCPCGALCLAYASSTFFSAATARNLPRRRCSSSSRAAPGPQGRSPFGPPSGPRASALPLAAFWAALSSLTKDRTSLELLTLKLTRGGAGGAGAAGEVWASLFLASSHPAWSSYGHVYPFRYMPNLYSFFLVGAFLGLAP